MNNCKCIENAAKLAKVLEEALPLINGLTGCDCLFNIRFDSHDILEIELKQIIKDLNKLADRK